METEALIRYLKTRVLANLDIRRAYLTLLLICAFVLFLFNHFAQKYEFLETIEPYNRSALIVDTPGCRIPKLDPFDPSVRHLIKTKEPYVCDGAPIFMITRPNRTIILNEAVLNATYNISAENVSCFYKAIYREKEPKGYIGENYVSAGDAKVLEFGVPLDEEFIEVECSLREKKFLQYIPLVPVKPIRNGMSNLRAGSRDSLNVVLIGIDSVSKLNFLRHFKTTHDFLTKNLSAFDMKGYTKVGDNTFPNLVPLLTGHFIEHYWNESMKDKMFFDHLDFIWKKYSDRGYRTFYAEDSPYTGTFNYLKRGFKNPPTDYYLRALAIAIYDSDLKKNGRGYCLNSQMEIDLIFTYLKDFSETMKNRLAFSFTMVSTLTHDYLNEAGYADKPTYNLLKDLWLQGVMNRSLVVVFSDHGIRFGSIRNTYIGKFEERMPFMYLTLPKWFLKKHKNVAKNLEENQNRLTTLFDVHATLYHLQNISQPISGEEQSIVTPNGLSLMGKISKYRTCEMAKILPHWCPCQVYQYVPRNDKFAIRVAFAIIEEINKELKPFEEQCARLEIDKITDARLGQANDMVLRFVKHQNDVLNRYVMYGDKVTSLSDFLVTLRALPGGGMFEGTVRHNVKDGTFKVLGISRINKYGKQSWCINSQILKKFCYCK